MIVDFASLEYRYSGPGHAGRGGRDLDRDASTRRACVAAFRPYIALP